MDKRTRMFQLRSNTTAACDNPVWGDGNLDSSVVIVGESPGVEEERQGRPFVGRTGRFLDDELRHANIERSRVYITNAVKCRGAIHASSYDFWLDILLKELEIVCPKTILCLGSIAASVLIHKHFKISDERGVWFDGPLATRVIATYHPSYVRRFGLGNSDTLTKFRRDLSEAFSLAEFSWGSAPNPAKGFASGLHKETRFP
ncbi:MAG: uracil-DNA glycosylase [Armatimonadota bacterium]|nr:uracil-DNA glycosylase [bacterium]